MNTHRQILPEWAPQSAVMLTWPHDKTDWQHNLAAVESVYLAMVKEISKHEHLLIVCRDTQHQQHIEQVIMQPDLLTRCVFALADSNDSWARDHGPITVLDNGKPLLLDFGFNGWGKKFTAEKDNLISTQLANNYIFECPLQTIDLILEGGSIDADGNGSLMTTEQCLLTDTRNPQYTKTDISKKLKQLLGIEQILWLNQGHLAGDDTDSHIDTLARFCSKDTIAYCSCDETDIEHYAALKAMEDQLKQFRNRQGQPYKLVPLPLPSAIYDEDGQRLPATYANFLIINHAVLVPVYNDPKDGVAIKSLQQVFNDREVIGINCLPIIQQYGSLHCLTMQLPEQVLCYA
ncbi:MAG: agmatine deiminase family protein [Gammaproteobacteria bacterium]|nr:agmatine deiminase family protein [Gammaproteobacteria bacterium]